MEAINPLPTNPLETYNYDSVGNRTDSNQNGASQFNSANELNEDGDFIYQYDNNGIMIQNTAKALSGPLKFPPFSGQVVKLQ